MQVYSDIRFGISYDEDGQPVDIKDKPTLNNGNIEYIVFESEEEKYEWIQTNLGEQP